MSGFLVSKRNYEDFTEGAAIAGGSIAGMAGYSKLRRMKGLKGPVSFKGGLLAAGVGGVGASLASREAFKRRKGKARELAQYRASVGKSLTLNSIAKEYGMNNKYLVSKALRDLDEVEKSFLTPVKGIKGGFMTRRFPDFTSSGKRQLAAKKTRAVEGLADSRRGLGSTAPKPFDVNNFYRQKNAAAAAASRASATPSTGRKFDPKFNAKDR